MKLAGPCASDPVCRHLVLLLRTSFFLAIVCVTFKEVAILTAPSFSLELTDADFACLMVFHHHFADLFDVKLTEDQVFDRGCRPADREMLSGLLQVDVLQADRHSLEGAP